MKQPSSRSAHSHQQKPTQEQIAAAAYRLYLENGCREGHDLEDWLQAEKLFTGRVEELPKVQVFEPAQKAVSRTLETRPVEMREHPLARDERGSASREEIRQKTTQRRPASRQPQWRTERPAYAKGAA